MKKHIASSVAWQHSFQTSLPRLELRKLTHPDLRTKVLEGVELGVENATDALFRVGGDFHDEWKRR